MNLYELMLTDFEFLLQVFFLRLNLNIYPFVKDYVYSRMYINHFAAKFLYFLKMTLQISSLLILLIFIPILILLIPTVLTSVGVSTLLVN